MRLEDELARWEATLRKSPSDAWIEAGLRALEQLARTMPGDRICAVTHGDFQPSNLLFEAGHLRGIIDWDLAHLGSAGQDLGWLMMFADPDSWAGPLRPWSPLTPEALAHSYQSRVALDDLTVKWFHAFAGYRFGAIACLNVKLHRSGRRVDDIWEAFAPSVLRLFEQSRELASRLPVT